MCATIIKNKAFIIILMVFMIVGLLAVMSGCGYDSDRKPVEITVWNSYNGEQLEVFNALVDEFNKNVGIDKNITVKVVGYGSTDELAEKVIDTAQSSHADTELPNLFTAYENTAFDLYQKGYVEDISRYFDERELDEYIEAFIDEGDVLGNGSILVFPIAKSTELLFVNKTDWDAFAQATGAEFDSLETIEGMRKTAELYYKWTDSQTPDVPNDGKAFMSRDSFSNYFLAGAEQLGHSIFDVDEDGKMVLDFDKKTIKKLWDEYPLQLMKGIYGGNSFYGSDNIRTQDVLVYIGSSAGATYFPVEISDSNGNTHDVEMYVTEVPHFEGTKPLTIQQGVGMVMVKKQDEQENFAAAEFLKWFTDTEQNIRFSVHSGYMPVKKEAFDIEVIKYIAEENNIEIEDNVLMVLETAMEMIKKESEPFTRKAFSDALKAQNILHNDIRELMEANRNVINERIAAGESPQSAASEFLTDAYFENWYNETLEALKKYEG